MKLLGPPPLPKPKLPPILGMSTRSDDRIGPLGANPLYNPPTRPDDRGGALGANPPGYASTPDWGVPTDPASLGGTGTTAAQKQGTPGTPGYTPDYRSLILGDPLWLQSEADRRAGSLGDAATRKSQTDQALINFGEVPDLASSVNGLGLDPNSAMYKMLFGDVDQNTRQGAQDLTSAGLSTVAGLSRDHTKSIADLLDTMAARGTVRSGATGVGLGQADQSYGQSQFKARNDLLTYLSGVQSAFNQAEQTRTKDRQTSLSDAVNRQIQFNPYVAPTPGTGDYADDQSAPNSGIDLSGLINSLNLGS